MHDGARIESPVVLLVVALRLLVVERCFIQTLSALQITTFVNGCVDSPLINELSTHGFLNCQKQ